MGEVPFMKADPKQGYLKVSVYGPPGSGKTFSTLLIAEGLAALSQKRIAYVDTERGTDFYAREIPSRPVHPEAFDFDALYTRSLKEVTDSIRSLPVETYGVVVIDSISHLWDAAQEAYEGKRAGKDGDKIPFGAWAKIKKPYKALLDTLMGLPMHVFILGRQKNVFEDNDGDIKKVGVAMKAEGDTQYEPHICLRMEASGGSILCHVEKDRSGILSGRLLVNPNFQMVSPIIPYLGQEQATTENEDDRVAADGELLDQEDEKNRKKVEESESLVAKFKAEILTAKTPEDLGKVGTAIAAAKRKILTEGKDVLTGIYNERRAELARRLMGGA